MGWAAPARAPPCWLQQRRRGGGGGEHGERSAQAAREGADCARSGRGAQPAEADAARYGSRSRRARCSTGRAQGAGTRGRGLTCERAAAAIVRQHLIVSRVEGAVVLGARALRLHQRREQSVSGVSARAADAARRPSGPAAAQPSAPAAQAPALAPALAPAARLELAAAGERVVRRHPAGGGVLAARGIALKGPGPGHAARVFRTQLQAAELVGRGGAVIGVDDLGCHVSIYPVHLLNDGAHVQIALRSFPPR